MRVFAIAPYGEVGGAEVHLLSFIAHRGPGVEVSALVLQRGPLASRLRSIGVTTWVAEGAAGPPDGTQFARFNRAFIRLIRRERPDVLWALGQKSALLAAAPCRAVGVPLVWHKVDFSWDHLVALPLAAWSTGVIGVSQAVLSPLCPFRRRVLGTVGVPITLPVDVARAKKGAGPVIGTVSRLVPYKGLHHMVTAAALLQEEFPRLRLVIAGGSVREYPLYSQELRRSAERLGIADRLELWGWVNSPVAALATMDVFLSATYRDPWGFGREGLGAALLEASWAGVPVVATRSGGTPEAVLDGRTGTLIERPDPVALADAAAAYLRDAEFAARTGENGRRFARSNFEPVAASERLFSLLDRARR